MVARVLALLALAAVLIALIVVIGDSVGSSDDPGKDGHKRSQKHGEEQKPDEQAETYVVQPDDTLVAIAEKTGVSVERLQQLNPKIDPQALPSGATLKLR
jgi:LysM repeat protein